MNVYFLILPGIWRFHSRQICTCFVFWLRLDFRGSGSSQLPVTQSGVLKPPAAHTLFVSPAHTHCAASVCQSCSHTPGVCVSSCSCWAVVSDSCSFPLHTHTHTHCLHPHCALLLLSFADDFVVVALCERADRRTASAALAPPGEPPGRRLSLQHAPACFIFPAVTRHLSGFTCTSLDLMTDYLVCINTHDSHSGNWSEK